MKSSVLRFVVVIVTVPLIGDEFTRGSNSGMANFY